LDQYCWRIWEMLFSPKSFCSLLTLFAIISVQTPTFSSPSVLSVAVQKRESCHLVVRLHTCYRTQSVCKHNMIAYSLRVSMHLCTLGCKLRRNALWINSHIVYVDGLCVN
jgi:hypothetical protein